jgi:hypothetical protein
LTASIDRATWLWAAVKVVTMLWTERAGKGRIACRLRRRRDLATSRVIFVDDRSG